MAGAVGMTGVLLAYAIDRERSGHPLVVFDYPHRVENEPLLNPTRARVVAWNAIVLPDGREVRIDSGPLHDATIVLLDFSGPELRTVDIEAGADGSLAVYALQPTWRCGGTGSRRRFLPIRIPLRPRTTYTNHRALVGHGRVVGSTEQVDHDGLFSERSD